MCNYDQILKCISLKFSVLLSKMLSRCDTYFICIFEFLDHIKFCKVVLNSVHSTHFNFYLKWKCEKMKMENLYCLRGDELTSLPLTQEVEDLNTVFTACIQWEGNVFTGISLSVHMGGSRYPSPRLLPRSLVPGPFWGVPHSWPGGGSFPSQGYPRTG